MNKHMNAWRNIFSIHGDTASHEEIKERLVDSTQVKGTNMCILICAILIAAIGLNMNSTAVIIGAMLISPIMGSIQAMGYGAASGDLWTVEKAGIGFASQIAISLLTSFVYFSLTPISNTTSELLARTTPTIWDVLIAVFGGIAGIIGVTRKEKANNIIPGVAIATALMPPLCTTGYGLATGQWRIAAGAFYLFVLNSYFIFITAVIVLMILRIPKKVSFNQFVGIASKIKGRLVVLTLVLLLPSIFFAHEMVKEEDVTGFEENTALHLTKLSAEVKVLFPEVDKITIGYMEYEKEDKNIGEQLTAMVYVEQPLQNQVQERLQKWLNLSYDDEVEIHVMIEE